MLLLWQLLLLRGGLPGLLATVSSRQEAAVHALGWLPLLLLLLLGLWRLLLLWLLLLLLQGLPQFIC
jgi:hypothetical protein